MISFECVRHNFERAWHEILIGFVAVSVPAAITTIVLTLWITEDMIR